MIDLLGADTDAENAEDDILLDLLMKNVLTEKEYIPISSDMAGSRKISG